MSALHQTFTEFILSGSTVFYPPTHFEVKKEKKQEKKQEEKPPFSPLPVSAKPIQPPKKAKKPFYRKNYYRKKPFYTIRLIHPLSQSLFH